VSVKKNLPDYAKTCYYQLMDNTLKGSFLASRNWAIKVAGTILSKADVWVVKNGMVFQPSVSQNF
jgi:hypothetical protein